MNNNATPDTHRTFTPEDKLLLLQEWIKTIPEECNDPFTAHCLRLAELHLRKNTDYGNSFDEVNAILPTVASDGFSLGLIYNKVKRALSRRP